MVLRFWSVPRESCAAAVAEFAANGWVVARVGGRWVGVPLPRDRFKGVWYLGTEVLMGCLSGFPGVAATLMLGFGSPMDGPIWVESRCPYPFRAEEFPTALEHSAACLKTDGSEHGQQTARKDGRRPSSAGHQKGFENSSEASAKDGPQPSLNGRRDNIVYCLNRSLGLFCTDLISTDRQSLTFVSV
jgi:hypothetical protein